MKNKTDKLEQKIQQKLENSHANTLQK